MRFRFEYCEWFNHQVLQIFEKIWIRKKSKTSSYQERNDPSQNLKAYGPYQHTNSLGAQSKASETNSPSVSSLISSGIPSTPLVPGSPGTSLKSTIMEGTEGGGEFAVVVAGAPGALGAPGPPGAPG